MNHVSIQRFVVCVDVVSLMCLLLRGNLRCIWIFLQMHFHKLSVKPTRLTWTFFFISPGVRWASIYLYPNERALLSPEQRCLHRAIQGLLRPRPTLRRVPLQQPPLPASTGLPLLHTTNHISKIWNISSLKIIWDCCENVEPWAQDGSVWDISDI